MNELLNHFSLAPVRRFWLISDLQQRDPKNARYCMSTGVDDFLSLKLKIDGVCYLGDSTEGVILDHLVEMADMQVAELSRVDAPIYYVMGNHEFDYHRFVEGATGMTIPMRDRIQKERQWHTTKNLLDWSFQADFGELTLHFFTDRSDPDDRTWVTTHGYQQDVKDAVMTSYNFVADIERERAKLANIETPFFTFSHYGFPGGNRDYEGDLQKRLLPLPGKIVAHFYGHSHIGDRGCGRENAFRQISTINDTGITQFDIASLENLRGTTIRSAVLEWYGGKRYGVYYRDHLKKRWEKCFVNP